MYIFEKFMYRNMKIRRFNKFIEMGFRRVNLSKV